MIDQHLACAISTDQNRFYIIIFKNWVDNIPDVEGENTAITSLLFLFHHQRTFYIILFVILLRTLKRLLTYLLAWAEHMLSISLKVPLRYRMNCSSSHSVCKSRRQLRCIKPKIVSKFVYDFKKKRGAQKNGSKHLMYNEDESICPILYMLGDGLYSRRAP